MNQANCLKKIPAVGPNQPPVIAWSDWRDGCGGSEARFPMNVDVNLLYNTSYGIGANDIDTIWVPPNVDVTVDYNGNLMQNPVRFNGLGHLGQDITFTGLYQMDWENGDKKIYDIKNNGNSIGRQDIDVISTRINKPWTQHLNECCNGTQTNKDLCGTYKPGASVCKSFLSQCTADQLKNDLGCQTMCNADLAECDRIKLSHCNLHPEDPFCTCVNVESDPDYQKFASSVLKNTGQGPRMGCSPFGKCNTGVDLLNRFLPSYVIKDRETPCPSYQNYVDQAVTVSGSGNVTDVKQSTDIKIPPTVQTSGGSGGSNNTNSSNNSVNQDGSDNSDANKKSGFSMSTTMWLLLFVVCIIIGIVGYVMYGKEESPRYAQQGNPYAQYPQYDQQYSMQGSPYAQQGSPYAPQNYPQSPYQ